MEGFVVRIMASKGFGFIKGEDGRDYFFHRDDIHGFFDDLAADLDSGRKVRVIFEPYTSEKGLRAASVARLDGGI